MPYASYSGVLLRSLADSNCCKRFCRPVPNHSAKVPLVVGLQVQRYAKIFRYARICDAFLRLWCGKPGSLGFRACFYGVISVDGQGGEDR